MEAIVAVYSDWGIGRDGTQPVVLKADRAHFRELTAGTAVIVGRRTLGDFPGGKPLKGRDNIVVSRQADLHIEGARVAHSTEEALAMFFPYLDTVHITKIDLCPESDSFFPDLDALPDWDCESGDWQEENGVRYCFCTYRKNNTVGF